MTTVTDTPPLPGELGRGPLGRATVLAHRLLLITVAFLIASLPAALALLLPPSIVTMMVTVLLAAPVAVGLSAAIAAWRDELKSVHPQPWASFWHGYRRNALDVLKVTLPALAGIAVVVVTVSNAGTAGVTPGYAWGLLAVAALLVLVTTRAIVLATFFSFRTRDLWRLAAFTLFQRPLSTAALVALLICAAGVVWVTNEAVLLLLGGVAARGLLHYERPVIELVKDRFTHEGQASSQ